ncbi:MAG: glycosyltransferase [Treponema sp.]|nr:glycosyltransferase [Treponema sp.]
MESSVFAVIQAWYFPILVGLGIYFFVLSLLNILEIRSQTSRAERKQGPLVSILIPMRNEEKNINKCLDSLRAQDYENYEILVIDDNSTDGTLAALNRIALEDTRVRVYQGMPLPGDWYGKPFALQQLAKNARGEFLILTDADTVHSPTSVSWMVTNMEASGADFISGYVGQKLKSFGEQITVPLMYFLTGFLLPLRLNRVTRHELFSFAVGQFIAIKRDVFEKIGGYSGVKKKTSEDMYLARYVKKQGFKTMFLDIGDQVQCRMYQGYRAALEGIGKNIFDFLKKNTLVVFLMAVAVIFFLFLPFPLLIHSLLSGGPHTQSLLAVNILYTLTWIALFLDRRIPWYRAFLWPLMFLNLVYMAFWSWYRTISGRGFLWKDRVVT